MYVLRGFVSINSFISNVPGTVSPIGELSSHSATFSREVGRYSRPAFPNVRLISFLSKLDSVSVPVDPDLELDILELLEWMFQRSIDGSFNSDRDTALQLIFNQFETKLDIDVIGPMETNGTYWLPSSITFKSRTAGDNNIKLWLSDTAFKAQYVDYEIVVVPPVVPLDDLHRNRTYVLELLQKISPSSHIKDVESYRLGIPDTLTISTPYDWTDKNDPTITQSTPWTVITYGNAANNSDLIKETIVAYILANSTYSREAWEKIYPDLFLPTEYYLTPMWHQYSLPNQQIQAGLYSPTVNIVKAMNLGAETFIGFEIPFISNHLNVVPTMYKGGLSLVAIGNPKNRNTIYEFSELWPQYANISTDQFDFNRIDPVTSQFIILLISMLRYAETMTQYSDVPVGFSRVKRGNYFYLSTNFNKIQYLVLLKSNILPN